MHKKFLLSYIVEYVIELDFFFSILPLLHGDGDRN